MKNKTAINLFLFISILLTQLTFGIPPAQAAATITVTTSADDIIVDTFCSLREAIMNANSNNTTHADCNAGNGSDKILFADDITTITLSGTLPNINASSELTIDGDGHITIDGSNTFRIMFLTSLGGFSLKNITLKNGGCTSCGGGGAILMIGTFSSINISNVIFLGNRQALYIQDFSASGVVHITDSQFINNTASSLSGGAINLESGSVIIQNSLFFGNTASNTGGAVYTRGNTTITNSSFANNVSPYGGAIYSDSSPVLTVTRSSFTDNHASGQGGGIYTYYENVNTFIANNTFSGNTAEAGGAIIGFASSTGAATLSNNTISGNSATVIGGGIYNTGNRISIYNNIISDNGGGDCTISDGSTVPGSNNLIKSLSRCGFNNGENGNIIGSDPNLGVYSLQGYFPLNTGSPAIDGGNNATCAAFPVNNQSQNGVTRPQGITCDIGAVEATISATYKSNASNDGWILEASETSNTGGTLNSAQTTFILGDDATDRQYRAILHFDTSALPDTAVVTNMTLKIKQQGSVTGTSPFNFGSLYVDMRNPAFGGSALELTDFNFAAKKVKPAVFNPNPVSGWFSARFNTGGKLYVNRTGVSQLRLYFSVDDNNNNIADFIRFFSGNATAANRPKLLIQYYVP